MQLLPELVHGGTRIRTALLCSSTTRRDFESYESNKNSTWKLAKEHVIRLLYFNVTFFPPENDQKSRRVALKRFFLGGT